MDPLEQLENQTRELTEYMHKHSHTAFGRYPLVFSLIGTFGVACVIYGFDDLLDQIELFHTHPILPLIVGILVLVGTGTLYKRIEKKFD